MIRFPIRAGVLVLLLAIFFIAMPVTAALIIPDTASFAGTTKTTESSAANQSAVHAKMLQLPLSFIENQGQAPSAVKYSVQAEGHTISFTPDKIFLIATGEKDNATVSSQVAMSFPGANTAPVITGIDRLPGNANYFTGNDSAKWKTDVPTYSAIQYTSLYPGIDLRYKGTLGNLKREFVVAPGADPAKIAMQYDGAESVQIASDRSLMIVTMLGVLTDEKPIAYQEIGGKKVPVAVEYRLIGEKRAGFVLGEYDHAYPLVIDPWLKYSSYIMPSQNGVIFFHGVTIDSLKNIYIVGSTSASASKYPTKNPYQSSLAGVWDGVITKLSPDGSTILYSTYLGGTADDRFFSIAVDPTGSIYVSGHSASSNYPTANAYQATLSGTQDTVVTKLAPAGNALIYSTYLGGTGSETAESIALDSSQNVYITGRTSSTDFPQINSSQSTYGGGDWDAFVTKIATDGQSLVYSTYLGGELADATVDSADWSGAGKNAVDSSGNSYVSGVTSSASFPVTGDALQSSLSGTSDGFVAKYDPVGTKLYATYLGGSGADDISGLAIDSAGSVYVAGTGILAKINSSLHSLDYSYPDGGSYGVKSIVVDSSGDLYAAGYTGSNSLPVIGGLSPATMSSSSNNLGYIFKLNPPGSALLWSSYLGGSSSTNRIQGITIDGMGNTTVVGYTSSSAYPYTSNALYKSKKGNSNGVISILSEIPNVVFSANPLSGNVPLDVQFTDTSSDNPTSWNWSFGDGTYSEAQNPVHTYTSVQKYNVTLTATNAFGSGTTTKTDYIQGLTDKTPVIGFTANKTLGKFPLAVQFNDTSLYAPTSWNWSFGDGTYSESKNPVHTYSDPGIFTVALNATNSNGFNVSAQANMIQVIDTPSDPLPGYRGININVANDEGVKYDVSNGVVNTNTGGIVYNYSPNTYFVNFRSGGIDDGLNPLHISKSSSSTTGELTTTYNQSGTFYLTFTGGQPTMPEGILMFAVNGSIPDDFAVHVKSSGYEWALASPSISNTPTLPTSYTYLDPGVDQTFTKNDFIYGPQTWRPFNVGNYPIHYGQNMNDASDTYRFMFIDLRVGALQNAGLNDRGMIKIDYTLTNLTSEAVFNAYGWYMNSNHGTGIIMTNSLTNSSRSGYTVHGIVAPPVADFTANHTSAYTYTPVQFTDTSENGVEAWLWNFGDGSTSTAMNPVHTYTNAGTYTVTFTATNSKGTDTATKTKYVTVTVPAPTQPAPAIAGVTPGLAYQNTTVAFTITGTNFEPANTTVQFRNLTTGVLSPTLTTVTATRIDGTLTIGKDEPADTWNVRVVTLNGGEVTQTGVLTVKAQAPPSIASVTPTTKWYRNTSVDFTITGKNFKTGQTAIAMTFPTNATALNKTDGFTIKTLNETMITGTVVVPYTAPTGTWNISVATNDGGKFWKPAAFTVSVPVTTKVTGITPAGPWYRNATVNYTIAGEGFVSSSVLVKFRNKAGTDLNTTGTVNCGAWSVTPTKIYGTIVVPFGAPTASAYTVSVTTLDGGTSSKEGAFTVAQAGTPGITSITPAAGTRNATVSFTIAGKNFETEPGYTNVSLVNSFDGKACYGAITDIAAAKIAGTFALPPGATTGSYDLVVTTVDGGTVLKESAFTINALDLPGITAINQTSGYRNTTVPFKITGKNFQAASATSVILQNPVTGTKLNGVILAASATQIEGTLSIPANATSGTYDLVVMTTDGGYSTKAKAFAINALPTPTLGTLNQTAGYRNSTVAFTLTGKNYQPGATSVRLYLNGSVAPIAATLTSVAETKITGTFAIPCNQPAGKYRLDLITLSGGSVMKLNAFTVNPVKQPAISGSTPATAYINSTYIITVKGQDFQTGSGTFVNLYHPTGPQNITVDLISVTPTLLNGTVTIPAGAPATDKWQLNVTTIDGGMAKPAKLAIAKLPAPTFGTITPTTSIENTTVAFSLSGKYYQTTQDGGTNVTFWNKATNQVLTPAIYDITSTQVVGSVALPEFSNGTWYVNITTADGGPFAKPAGFTVSKPQPPTLKAFTPKYGYRGTTLSFTVSGTNFQTGNRTTFTLVPPGQAGIAAELTSITATQISGYVNLPTDATPGKWNANVTTVNGGTRTLTAAVTAI